MPTPSRAVRRSLLTLLALAATLAPALAVQPAAHAAATTYVALGDSYSSGTGTRSYIEDGTDCQRSTFAYPSLISAQRGYTLDFRACSGATVADVANTQLGSLSSATNFVTISVGGNDAGFADVLTECATPWWAGDCDGAIDQAQAYINNTLPGTLSSLYGSIGSLAPSAQVVVVGYPRIFMGEDCNALTWFAPEEQARLNQMADLLNTRVSAQAGAHGFSFANPTNAFIGHAVCDNPEWINGLSNPISESYHPNRDGQASGYAPTVSPVLTGAGLTVTAATRRAAAASGDELAARQRQYAALDSAIEPAEFRIPDLRSPQMRKAAREAGINLDRWLARQQ